MIALLLLLAAPPRTFDYDSAYQYVATGNGYTAVVFIDAPVLDVPGSLVVDGRFIEGTPRGVYVLARGKKGVIGFKLPDEWTAAEIAAFCRSLYPLRG